MLLKANTAFTLAELLISLAILGVIATFTIPKILTSQQSGQKVAVFRETIAAINGAGYQGLISGELTPSNHGTYLLDHLNAARICRNNAVTEQCFAHTADVASWETAEPGLVMHNGATIAGVSDGGAGLQEGFVIDWNGATLPNKEGEDQIFVEFCFTDACSDQLKSGQVHSTPTFPISDAFFTEIFTNQ